MQARTRDQSFHGSWRVKTTVECGAWHVRLPDAVSRGERYCSGITKWAAHPTPVRLAALDVTAGSKF